MIFIQPYFILHFNILVIVLSVLGLCNCQKLCSGICVLILFEVIGL